MKLKIENTHRKPMRQKNKKQKKNTFFGAGDKISWKADEGKNSIHKGKKNNLNFLPEIKQRTSL